MPSVLWQEGTGRALWLVMRHRRQLSSEYFQRGRCGKLAKRILDVFLEMPGYARKKSYTVCDKIMQTDPRSCVGAGQYNRKVCHGIEISLMSRFEAWRVEHEKRAGNYDPSEELPF